MDNNELDKILKEKLKVDVKPSQEFEDRINKVIETEKIKHKENEFKPKDQTSKNNKKLKRFTKYLAIAAVFVIIFAVGINLKDSPLLTNQEKNKLLSISAIQPTKLESGVLSNNSEFIIKTEGKNVDIQDVQKSLYIEPALEYTIEKTSNPKEYKLKFKQNIPDNTILKLQYVKNKITQNSWAYQTSNKLSITRTYPYNDSSDVSKNTVIDIEFSYASTKNVESNVEIAPNVDGNWTHIGSIWRFTPNKELEENKYRVKVKKGIKAENEVLDEEYEFKFYVGESKSDSISYRSISLDGILTLKPDENGKIIYNSDNDTNLDINNIEIKKFDNIRDFEYYVENKNYTYANEYKTYKAKKLEQMEENVDFRKCIELQSTLPKGFYVAILKSNSGKELCNIPIQVSEFSAYSMVTERDALLWVAKEKDLAKGIEVEYLGKTLKTNNQGVVKFEDITDNSKKVKYAKIQNELLIGLVNYTHENYPNAYIYTDRPLYKSTDTINIWGFVPKSLFYEDVENEFYVELGEEGKKKINLEENGNFVYKIDLKNHLNSEYTEIKLYYKNKVIGTRYISIQNYELQNYNFEVINNKKYGIAGTNYDFDVKVTHLTGLNVPNKKVTIKYGDGKLETKSTDEYGIAHFSVYLENEENSFDPHIDFNTIEIFNGDENEYEKSSNYINFGVLKRDVYGKFTQEEDIYKLNIYKLDQTKDISISYDANELYNGEYETEVQVNLVEEVNERFIDYYEYDEYKKENVPVYRYNNYIGNEKVIKTVKSTNGLIEVKKEELGELKKENENKSYSYTLEFIYKDQSGKQTKNTAYYYEKSESGYYINSIEEGDRNESSDYSDYESKNELAEEYDLYRYYLYCEGYDIENKKYHIGENIALKLREANKAEIKNEGKLLNVVFKENISKVDITTENTINYKFEESDFPGVKIVSSYFKDGKFYRMPPRYFDFNEELKKVNIEIKPDKQNYKPGETVNIELKATSNGTPVKTDINISAVNEAVFSLEEDNLDLLEQIYTCKPYPIYTHSTYYDNIFISQGGAGGGGERLYKRRICRYCLL